MSAHWRRRAPPEVARFSGGRAGALGSRVLARQRLSSCSGERRFAPIRPWQGYGRPVAPARTPPRLRRAKGALLPPFGRAR